MFPTVRMGLKEGGVGVLGGSCKAWWGGCVEWELDCIIDMQGGEWSFFFFQYSFVCVCILFFSPPL